MYRCNWIVSLRAGLLMVCAVYMSAQVSVLTQRNDNARTGQNTNEVMLTPANVNTAAFGKLFSVPVDGLVYAQPLYLPNITIPGKGVHNVFFVATEHDSVYALDADSHTGATATPLWQVSLLDPAHGAGSGATTEVSSDVSTSDITPEIGITATPVIDASSGTMYLVSETVENGYPIQRLHALDVTTGAEKFGGPIALQASVAGTGSGSSGGVLSFDPRWSNIRAGLLLQNGIVYIASGAHGDNGPWHGWVLGYQAATLRQSGVYCTNPSGIGGGIWMSGTGLAGDVADPTNHPFGRMFVATANGWFTASPPYSGDMDFSDDEMNLDLSNGIPTVADSFTPYNQQQLDHGDWDVGSGGVLVLPDQASGPKHLLVQAGKWGTIYVVNRDSMGGYQGTSDNIVQEIIGQIHGIWGAPAYWNNTVYFGGTDDQLKAFSLSGGQLSPTPISMSQETYQYPGPTPAISASGNTNGIVWTIKTETYSTSGPAVLVAHDAVNLANTLYSSGQNQARDNPGNPVKFSVPTIANGKVYVPAQYQVSVFGLLNGEPPGMPPSPPGGSGSSSGVEFTQGFSTATQLITFNGSTDLDDTRLQLTNGGGYEAGSAFYNTPVNIQSFTTDFTFQLSTAVADGMTFTIQGIGPSALGASGAGLGYSGISSSVAVKFDLYNNAGEGVDSTGLYTGGAMPTIPAIDLSNSGIDLHSGDTMAVHLAYYGATLTMKITDGVTNATYTTSWSVNIPSLVGGTTAYVGFTGGTGGASASQKVESWTFSSGNASGTNAGSLVFYPVTPCRVADTRNAYGPLGGPGLGSNSSRSFPVPSSACGIPADAVAYSLNVTVVPSEPLPYITLWPTGQPLPDVSTLNSVDGRVVANAAIVPAGTSGSISAYVTGHTDLILDINGYFAAPNGQGNGSNPSIFATTTPCRALDTRNGAGPLGGPGLPANSTRDFPIPSSSCGVPQGVSAYAANVTAIPDGSLQFLTLWPTGQAKPNVSTLNAVEGEVVANAAIVPAGSNGSLSMYVAGPANIALDLNGYFVPYTNTGTTTGMFVPVTPCRVVDTRQGAGILGGPTLAAGATRSFPIPSGACGVPANAQAYVLNVTAVPAGPLQHLTLWPTGHAQPNVSTLNSTDGRVVANEAIVPAGTNGAVTVYVTDASDVILDISGYITP